MVAVYNLIDLMNVNNHEVIGCYQEGEEQQDPESFNKDDLVFLSGEELPKCWTDPHYREQDIKR
jgi:hypothetical protein